MALGRYGIPRWVWVRNIMKYIIIECDIALPLSFPLLVRQSDRAPFHPSVRPPVTFPAADFVRHSDRTPPPLSSVGTSTGHHCNYRSVQLSGRPSVLHSSLCPSSCPSVLGPCPHIPLLTPFVRPCRTLPPSANLYNVRVHTCQPLRMPTCITFRKNP